MEVLSVKNLGFSYPDNGFEIQNINFSLKSGEMLLITGPCGCGKTTLLRLLKPEISPKGNARGTVDTKYDSCRMGYLFQNPEAGIVCNKVSEELVFGAENLGLSREEIKHSLAEVSAYLGIEKYMDKLTSELSGGMKQIVNLASILMMKPRVLLLDEPTKGLDPIAAVDFFNLLMKLKEELSVSIIVVEHNLDNYLKSANQVLYMENGKAEYLGNPLGFCEHLMVNNKPYRASLPKTVKLSKAQPCFSVNELYNSLSADELNALTAASAKGSAGNTLLTLKNGYFRYEKNAPDVLKGINLELRSGMVYGIIGGNGAGKTTLLSVLLGYRKLYKGKIGTKAKVAYLPQNVSMVFSEDKLINDYLRVASQEKIDEMLAKYSFTEGIKELLDKNPLDLSGGQQQKAGIFKMLLAGADLYLLDEPVNGLDGMEKNTLIEVLKSLKNDGKTVVFVSHELEFVEEACDELMFMAFGEVLNSEAPEKVFANNRFYTTVAGKIRGLMENE